MVKGGFLSTRVFFHTWNLRPQISQVWWLKIENLWKNTCCSSALCGLAVTRRPATLSYQRLDRLSAGTNGRRDQNSLGETRFSLTFSQLVKFLYGPLPRIVKALLSLNIVLISVIQDINFILMNILYNLENMKSNKK